MSQYKVITLEFKNREMLVKALVESGVPFEEGMQENGLAMYGYHGDKRRETATFVIRRKHIETAANDMGFALQSNGSYAAIISEYDSGEGRRGSNILNQVKQGYSMANALSRARQRGYMLGARKVAAGGVILVRVTSGS